MKENQVHIPNGWFESTILELCHIGRGRVISQKAITENIGEYPVYSSQTQNNGEMGRIDTYDFDGDYVTWTTDGANAGTVFFRTGKFNCTNVCGTLKEKDEKLDLRFLAYKLSTVAKDHVSYVGNPKLMNGTMSKVSLVIPKFKLEQTQIAAILSKVDEAITQTEYLITKYNRIKTGLMQELFTKGIDEHGNIRSEQNHEFKDSPLGRIPKEWEVAFLDEIKEFITSGSRGWAKYYNVEGSQFIRITNLKRRQIEINKTEMKFVKLPGSTEGMRSKLHVGDLLISITADLGIIGVVPADFGNAFVNQHIALVRLIQTEINPNFIGYFLCSQQGQIIFSLLNDGGAKAGLNLKAIGRIPVIKPSKAEQNLIVERIEAVKNTLINFDTHLSKLQSLKTGLMQDLLSGKVRVGHLVK